MRDKIKGLILLQDCDNKIRIVDNKIKEGPLKIKKLEDEYNAGQMAFQEEYNRLESLKKNRREIEQEVLYLENKKEKSQIKLNNIKSNKEYTAVLKEIEVLDGEKTQIEDKVLQLMEDIEIIEKNCLENDSKQKKLKIQFDSFKREVEKELEMLSKEANILAKQRIKHCEVIEKDLLERYIFLKERKGGQAIGAVVGGICQACHMGIPPQKFNELIKGHSLLSCPNCNRLIYWGEDEFFLKALNKS